MTTTADGDALVTNRGQNIHEDVVQHNGRQYNYRVDDLEYEAGPVRFRTLAEAKKYIDGRLSLPHGWRYTDAAVTEEEKSILAKYYNAANTYYCAGGHHKAEMNRQLMEKYAAEAGALGIELPQENEAAQRGTFNGVGAT
jgi:hypothetical protein